ncbi:porin [Candidatus Pelagibacter sp.]|nr:porin [Candidatus Pelagibacter sp.]
MNIKKIGLTALAGSLVAMTAAVAGELAVSGSAKLSYTSKGGNEDANDTGTGFGMQENIGLNGSGEMDNGMTVSLSHTLHSDSAGASTSSITLDMGSAGVLMFAEGTSGIGISAIDDVMPTAEEEVSNGLGITAANSATGAAQAGNSYEANMGKTGFNYAYAMDMGSIVLGYSPKNTSARVDDGGTSGAGAATESGKSVHVVLDSLVEGLTVYAGTANNAVDDHDTAALKYAAGPVTVGYQWSEIDREAANAGSAADSERTQGSIAFAVNDNLSVSYGMIETEIDGQANDEELSGFSVGYSMGGMTVNAHRNEGKDMGGAANNESEHTEISVSFAF